MKSHNKYENSNLKEEKSKKSIKSKINFKKSKSEKIRWFGEHIEKAGYEITPFDVEYFVNRISIFVAALFSLYLFINGIISGMGVFKVVLNSFLLFFVSFFLMVIFLHFAFRIFVDLKKFRRKLMIEEVLPEFFQLASANIRAGMPIDRALWFAVRPKFGVLAKEIEVVAKKTFGGGKLDEALVEFARKYDSVVVMRSVYLLNESMKAGGNLGDLLDKLSENIQSMKTLKKEMAANVTTYAIFITFAAIIAAPLLFGLSGQLLTVVDEITSDVDIADTDMDAVDSGPSGMGVPGGMDVGFGNIGEGFGGGETINKEHYIIFVYVCLTFSSVLSAMIVSTIKKGNVKEGIHYIPLYLLTSFLIFNVSDMVMGSLLGGFI